MNCKNKVSQWIPEGFGYKEIKSPCGCTDIHGGQLLCNKCMEETYKKYPQGWRNAPGDICPHGTYIGDRGGPDYICGYCEGN